MLQRSEILFGYLNRYVSKTKLNKKFLACLIGPKMFLQINEYMFMYLRYQW